MSHSSIKRRLIQASGRPTQALDPSRKSSQAGPAEETTPRRKVSLGQGSRTPAAQLRSLLGKRGQASTPQRRSGDTPSTQQCKSWDRSAQRDPAKRRVLLELLEQVESELTVDAPHPGALPAEVVGPVEDEAAGRATAQPVPFNARLDSQSETGGAFCEQNNDQLGLGITCHASPPARLVDEEEACGGDDEAAALELELLTQVERGNPSAPARLAEGSAASPQHAAASGGPVPAPAQDVDWGEGEDDAEQLQALAALEERARRSVQGAASTSGGPSAAAGAGPAPRERPAVRVGAAWRDMRYTVLEVHGDLDERVLLLAAVDKEQKVWAHLRPPWSEAVYRVGDACNLMVARLDEFEGQLHALLDCNAGFLVLHPDVLLSGTRITTSHDCARRSVLEEWVGGTGTNDKAVKGTLQHLLIQGAFTDGLRTSAELRRLASKIVGENTESLLDAGMTAEEALEYLTAAIPPVLRWMTRYLRDAPAPGSLLSAGYDSTSQLECRRAMSVSGVVDIEEAVWAPKYGIKGMIDATVQLTLMTPGQPGAMVTQTNAGPSGGKEERVVAPLEIKTGKPHGSHRAQVLLYLLLLEERYGQRMDWGVLWLTGQADPTLIRRQHAELAALLAVRNRLAFHLVTPGALPPLAADKRVCRWCFQRDTCAVAHKTLDGGDALSFTDGEVEGSDPDGSLAAAFQGAAGHLDPAACAFLKHWDRLLHLEESGSVSRRPEVWNMTGQERESLGRCVGGLQLQGIDADAKEYRFGRPSLLGTSFSPGELLLLSLEGAHPAVARVHVVSVSPSSITVACDKLLRPGLLTSGQAAPGVVHGSGSGPGASWRLDRDDVSFSFVRQRGYLFDMMRAPAPRTSTGAASPAAEDPAARLRRLVVDLAPPRVGSAPGAPAKGTDEALAADAASAGLNAEQRAAVASVRAGAECTLVLGVPGSGKTSAIVGMVRAMVAGGHSVLVSSYTNSAVDNILLKLADLGTPLLRLGRASGVHMGIRAFLPGGERYPDTSVAGLHRLAAEVPVVGVTCLGVAHPLLRHRVFDLCILDEAGQLTLPSSLGPLLKARRFALVGDNNQLPPLVASKAAQEAGLGVSLFERLATAHPQAVISLAAQYRMAAPIMALSNSLIYGGSLRCGDQRTACSSLGLERRASLASQPRWIREAWDPDRHVVFLDTSAAGLRESAAGDALSNEGEVRMVVALARAGVAAGLAQASLGVISPYRRQVAALQGALGLAALPAVEALTVDRCQGRDKPAILISFVRSNEARQAGTLLRDWRRMNVALTRARSKLVLIGDLQTLCEMELFQRLRGLVQELGGLVTLESGWETPHPPHAGVAA